MDKLKLLVLLVLLSSAVFAQQPTLMGLQGKLTNSTTGAKIQSADLRVNINDSSGIVFNQNYSNAISNGIFELTLGSTYQLNLSYNEEYNLTIFVNNNSQLGEPYAFRGGQGEVGAGDIATTESFVFSNVSVTGNVSVGGNFSVDTNVLFVDAENNLVGIGTTSPAYKLDVIGDVNASNYYINGSSIFDILDNGTINRSVDLTLYNQSITNLYEYNYSLDLSDYPTWKERNDTIAEFFDNATINRSVNLDNYNQSIDLGDYELKSENVSLWNKSGDTAIFGGSVGIGKISPNYKLDVAGTINASGLNISGYDDNATFEGDVKILGTLYGGSPLKVSGGIDVTGNITTSGNSGIRVKVGAFTRDVSLASGTQAVTGVGFPPKAVMFIGAVGNTGGASWGYTDGSTHRSLGDRHNSVADTWQVVTTGMIYFDQGGGPAATYTGTISSFDNDGFTISWTKAQSPTGTADIYYLAFG